MVTDAMVEAMEELIEQTKDENERRGMQKMMDMLCEEVFE